MVRGKRFDGVNVVRAGTRTLTHNTCSDGTQLTVEHQVNHEQKRGRVLL